MVKVGEKPLAHAPLRPDVVEVAEPSVRLQTLQKHICYRLRIRKYPAPRALRDERHLRIGSERHRELLNLPRAFRASGSARPEVMLHGITPPFPIRIRNSRSQNSNSRSFFCLSSITAPTRGTRGRGRRGRAPRCPSRLP